MTISNIPISSPNIKYPSNNNNNHFFIKRKLKTSICTGTSGQKRMTDISSYHVEFKGQCFVRNKSHCLSNFHLSMPTWLAYKPKKALQTPMPTWLAHKPKKALQTKVNEIKGRDNKAIQRKADEIKGREKKSETALEGRSWKNKKKEKPSFFLFSFFFWEGKKQTWEGIN